MGRKKTIKTHLRLPKGHLWDHFLLEMRMEDLEPHVQSKLTHFGYEHEITAEIDLDSGDYVITELDGFPVNRVDPSLFAHTENLPKFKS